MSLNINSTQKEAFSKLSRLKCGALFMKMGMGKTKVVLDLARSRKKDYDFIVWIAPASLIRDVGYKGEIIKWGADLMDKIVFFTLESMGASVNKFLKLKEVVENFKTFCVLDESLAIKNIYAKRTKNLSLLSDKFTYRFILNGTPVTKSILDMHTQINFLSPKILNMTEAQFANNFMIYKVKKEWGSRPWRKWSKPANEKALVEIIKPYIFDCELCVDVEKEETIEYACLNIEERRAYKKFKEDAIAMYLDKSENFSFLAFAQRFQNFYCLCEDKINTLIKDVEIILKKGEKVIIYVKFIKEFNALVDILGRTKCCLYNGSVKLDVEEFKTKKDILICTYGVGSLGLNLQFCNNLIFFTPTFDYKLHEQAKYRIYRTGQLKNVHIKEYYTDTKLDDLVYECLSRKENLLNRMSKYISKKGVMNL